MTKLQKDTLDKYKHSLQAIKANIRGQLKCKDKIEVLKIISDFFLDNHALMRY